MPGLIKINYFGRTSLTTSGHRIKEERYLRRLPIQFLIAYFSCRRSKTGWWERHGNKANSRSLQLIYIRANEQSDVDFDADRSALYVCFPSQIFPTKSGMEILGI